MFEQEPGTAPAFANQEQAPAWNSTAWRAAALHSANPPAGCGHTYSYSCVPRSCRCICMRITTMHRAPCTTTHPAGAARRIDTATPRPVAVGCGARMAGCHCGAKSAQHSLHAAGCACWRCSSALWLFSPRPRACARGALWACPTGAFCWARGTGPAFKV